MSKGKKKQNLGENIEDNLDVIKRNLEADAEILRDSFSSLENVAKNRKVIAHKLRRIEDNVENVKKLLRALRRKNVSPEYHTIHPEPQISGIERKIRDFVAFPEDIKVIMDFVNYCKENDNRIYFRLKNDEDIYGTIHMYLNAHSHLKKSRTRNALKRKFSEYIKSDWFGLITFKEYKRDKLKNNKIIKKSKPKEKSCVQFLTDEEYRKLYPKKKAVIYFHKSDFLTLIEYIDRTRKPPITREDAKKANWDDFLVKLSKWKSEYSPGYEKRGL